MEKTVITDIPKSKPTKKVYIVIEIILPVIVRLITRNKILYIVTEYRIESVIVSQIKKSFLFFFKILKACLERGKLIAR